MAIPKSGGNFPNDFYKAEVWSALTLDNWYADGLIPQIANTNYEGEIKGYGQIVHIRRKPKGVINPYVADTPLQWNAVVDAKTTLTIDYAFSSAHMIGKIDEAQMDLEVMSGLAVDINAQMMEKENQIVFNALPTMSFNPLNVQDNSTNAVVITESSADYIISGLTSLRTKFNRRRAPKKGRYVVVAPEVEDILLRANGVRYDAIGKENTGIQTGEFGLRIAGFDILVSEFVAGAGTAGAPYLCPAGVREAFTFARQLVDADTNVSLQDYHGRGAKFLNVFGFQLTQPDGMGLWKVRVV